MPPSSQPPRTARVAPWKDSGTGIVPSTVQNKVVGDIEIGDAILQVRNEGVRRPGGVQIFVVAEGGRTLVGVLGPGVGTLQRETVIHALADLHQQAVVFGIISPQRSHDAAVVGIDPLNIFNLLLEGASRRNGEHELAIGAKGDIREGHLVHILYAHRNVYGMRAHITNHHRGTGSQLSLNGEIPLIVVRAVRIGLDESHSCRVRGQQRESLVWKIACRRSLRRALQKKWCAVGAVDEQIR